ncbi:hypothetical protein [Phenylobacterium sp. J367]|uniref:hypothetical protein n=1 Tax=Phenylobacterium sp. J367 TaxID=2898435 RepID=UPI0021514F25|nr:hypothetical protein [Phenylobacterium sp. J367]MCR5879369.1 hypothetical protein [Phenylobacterium sp. J367]
MLSKTFRLTVIGLAAGAIAVPAIAQPPPAPGLSVYPAKGQSQSKQNQDRSECNTWAVNQTGFDPALAQAPPEQKGARARGALAGAAVGGLAGSLGGEAGGGAAVGAATGVVVGGSRQRRANREAKARQEANLQGYNNALAACLKGRGYTVN